MVRINILLNPLQWRHIVLVVMVSPLYASCAGGGSDTELRSSGQNALQEVTVVSGPIKADRHDPAGVVVTIEPSGYRIRHGGKEETATTLSGIDAFLKAHLASVKADKVFIACSNETPVSEVQKVFRTLKRYDLNPQLATGQDVE